MTSPCPRCGTTRIDPVPHGPMYRLVWAVGYRLCRCSRCRLPRFVRKHQHESPNSLQSSEKAAAGPHFDEERMSSRIAGEAFAPKVTKQVASADSSNRGSGCCPVCGGSQYHRSRRTTLERILLRPRMARCENCGSRFPYTMPVKKSPDSFHRGEEAAAGRHYAEETREIAEETFAPKVSKQVASADSSNRGWGHCPACGSTEYRRSRRATLERILLRPRMARCRKCRKRFPYPE
jgi:hypothetical protein